MPHQNRVTPYGEIVAFERHGRWMGNRGSLHRERRIVRPWNGKRWITCALEFKGWIAPQWEPGRWTALFFDDEAVAFAAGHRPCALCRRADYVRYCDALGLRGADAIDARLHRDRLDGRHKRLQSMAWVDVPDGTFVELDGQAMLVVDRQLRPWSSQHATEPYGAPRERPTEGTVEVITPMINVLALRAGYQLDLCAAGNDG